MLLGKILFKKVYGEIKGVKRREKTGENYVKHGIKVMQISRGYKLKKKLPTLQ